MINSFFRVFVAAMFVNLSLSTARATGFNELVGFGDSTFDSGYFLYNSMGIPAYDAAVIDAVNHGDSGAFVANGVMNSIILAKKFGLSAIPVGASSGGTNYANGGSLTMLNNHLYPTNLSTIQQIQNYLASVNGSANPHALYVIRSGDNDITYSTDPTFLKNSASALAAQVSVLQKVGARIIMAPNSYASASLAGPGGDIAPGNVTTYAISRAYFLSRWTDLSAAGVHFIPADIDNLFKYVAHNPTLFGFTAFSVLADNNPAADNPSGFQQHALWAYPLPSLEQQQTFLFVDPVHLTTAGQTIEADYYYSLLVAPSQVSLLVESAVQSGLELAATIERQIDLTGRSCRQNSIDLWAIAGGKYQSVKNARGFPGASGFPFGGTVGVDYQIQCGLILGMAFTADSQTQHFSKMKGGHFDQVAEAPSLYVSGKVGPIWGDIIATYGAFQNKIKRRVPLGIFIDENDSDPSGYSLALALRGGGDFKWRRVITGPILDGVLQRVHLDGFTEKGTSGATALSYASQMWNSLVSQLGWRILVDVGKWQPSAEARWNHEWAGRNNRVTAWLTSVAEAPSYTTTAVPIASDWASAWLGTSYKINSCSSMRGTLTAVFFNPQVTIYGGELGFDISF